MKRIRALMVAATVGPLVVGCGGGGEVGRAETVQEETLVIESEFGGDLDDFTPESRAVSKRKGIQLVILSRWNSDSCDRLISVLTDPGAPSEIEISFVPYFNRSDPFGNAMRVAEAALQAGKKLTLAPQLGYKDVSDSDLKKRAKAFNDQFLVPLMNRYPGQVTFKLVPCLEDRGWDLDTFKRKAALMVTELDWNKVGSLNIRRSSESDIRNLPGSLTVTRRVGSRDQRKTFVLQREFHTYLDQAANHHAYSNDGVFGYLDRTLPGATPEREDSCANANPPTQPRKYKLSALFGQIDGYNRSQPNAFLLWRPSYNLFTRQVRGGIAFFQKPSTPPDRRSDTAASPGFNETEKAVLKQFFGMR